MSDVWSSSRDVTAMLCECTLVVITVQELKFLSYLQQKGKQ